MLLGLDLLGIAKYPGRAIEAFPQGVALGCFSREFGDALPVVEVLARSGKVPLIRVHLLWSNTHTFSAKNVPYILKEARRWDALAAKTPGVIFEISPFCEHSLQSPDTFLDMVKSAAPHCRPVNTPSATGAISSIYKNEIHGLSLSRDANNFSFDGDICDRDTIQRAKKLHSKADVLFLWIPQFNLHKSMTDRNRMTRPTVHQIKDILAAAH